MCVVISLCLFLHNVVCTYIVQLEMDLQKVKVERLRSSKAVGDYMEAFERKRTQDLKVQDNI